MTMTTFVGGLVALADIQGTGGSSNTDVTIDASGEKVGLTCCAPKTGNINKIHWATGTTTTGATVDVRIETISARYPSGTLWATDTNGSHVVVAADDNVTLTTTLTAAAAVTKGDYMAVVVVQSTGNMAIRSHASNRVPSFSQFPEGGLYTTSWATASSLPMFFLEYDDGSIFSASGFLVGGGTVTAETYDSADTPDERGNIFQVSVPCSVTGVSVQISGDSSFVCDVVLYDSSSVALATKEISNTQKAVAASVARVLFDDDITLTPGVNYRLVVKPTHASIRTIIYVQPAVSGQSSDIFGTTLQYTSRTNAGAWSQNSAKTAFILPILGGFDDGATAGGLMTHPGMAGGMRG